MTKAIRVARRAALAAPEPRAVLDRVRDLGGILAGPLSLPGGRAPAFLLSASVRTPPEALRLSFGEIQLLCVTAITKDELAFATRQGPRALLAALASLPMPEASDLERPSVVST